MRDVEAERNLEELPGKMRRRARPRRSVAVFARIGLRERDQFLHAVGRQRRMHRDYVCGRAHQCYRRKVAKRIVGNLCIETRVDDETRRRGKQCVAVWCTLCRRCNADIAAAPGEIFHVELLPHAFRKLLRNEARGGVVGTARADGNDHLHWTRWIILRKRTRAELRGRNGGSGKFEKASTSQRHAYSMNSRWTAAAHGD